MLPTEPSPHATFFRFPRSYRILIIYSVAAAAYMAYQGIVVMFFDKAPSVSLGLPLVAFAGALGIQIFRMLRTIDDQIAVDESGIWRVPRKGAPVFIGWNEAAGLGHTGLLRRLTVIDRSGTRKIELSSRLDNFDELSQFVFEHTKTRPTVTRTPWPVNDWVVRAKAVVRVLYVSLRFLFLPLILVFQLAGLRPETVVATYTLSLFFIILPMAQARIGLGYALALRAAGGC